MGSTLPLPRDAPAWSVPIAWQCGEGEQGGESHGLGARASVVAFFLSYGFEQAPFLPGPQFLSE